ncbi:MAG: hypothetical protein PHU56_03205 [Candidatus Pacebacteria bacterium]|nr:hypothetical protein [Candidatus Paceibacterota bacterium]
MKPFRHIVASALLGLMFLIFIRPFWAALAAFLAGVFIDLDHLIDFWALKPDNLFSVKDFLDSEKHDRQAKWVFVFLHSWELIAALWLLAFIGHWPTLVTALAAGFTLHMIMDIANLRSPKMHPLTYSLIFRAVKKFKKTDLLAEKS